MQSNPNLDYLDTHVSDSTQESTVADSVEQAVLESRKIEEEIYQLNKQLVDLKDKRDYILKKHIPNLLISIGTTLIKTPLGFRVNIKKYNYLKIKDKDRLESYLESRGDETLLDSTFRIKKLTEHARYNIRRVVADLGGIISSSTHAMHHSTQRKYFNDLLNAEPQELDRIKQIGEVSEYYETRIHKETE